MFIPQYTSKFANEDYIPQTPSVLFTELSINKSLCLENSILPLVNEYPQNFMNIHRMRTPVVLLQCYKPDSELCTKINCENKVEKVSTVKKTQINKITENICHTVVVPTIRSSSIPIISSKPYTPVINEMIKFIDPRSRIEIEESEKTKQNLKEIEEVKSFISPMANKINIMKRRELSPQTNRIEDRIKEEKEKKIKNESNIKSFLDNIVSVSAYKSSKQIKSNHKVGKKEIEIENENNKKEIKPKIKEITQNINNKNRKSPIKMSQFKRKNVNDQSNSNMQITKKLKIEIQKRKLLENKDFSSPLLFDNLKKVNTTLNDPQTKELFSVYKYIIIIKQEVYELISSPSLEVDSSVLMKTNFLYNDSKSISAIKEMTVNNESVENYDKELKLLTDMNLILKSLKNDNHYSDTYIFSLYQQLTQYSIVEIKNIYNESSSELYKEIESVYEYINEIITYDMTLFSTTFYHNVDDLKDCVMHLLEFISNNNKTISNRTLILIFTVLISKFSSIYYVIPLICHELITIIYDVFLNLFKSVDFHSNEERFNISLNLYEIYHCDKRVKIDEMISIIKSK